MKFEIDIDKLESEHLSTLESIENKKTALEKLLDISSETDSLSPEVTRLNEDLNSLTRRLESLEMRISLKKADLIREKISSKTLKMV